MVIWFFILCVLCDLCGSIQILVCQAYRFSFWLRALGELRGEILFLEVYSCIVNESLPYGQIAHRAPLRGHGSARALENPPHAG